MSFVLLACSACLFLSAAYVLKRGSWTRGQSFTVDRSENAPLFWTGVLILIAAAIFFAINAIYFLVR